MVWLPGVVKILKLCLFFLTECTNVTYTQTDGQTSHDDIGRACGKSCKITVKYLRYFQFSLSVQ